MKKNVMMRVASALLVAVLLTTCAISGTFAKYTTSASATDKARVAYWGFKNDAALTLDLFDGTYDSENVKIKDNVGDGFDNVIAPGTSKEAHVTFAYTNYKVGGTEKITAPEVKYQISVDATAEGNYNSLDANPNFKWTLKKNDDTAATEYDTVENLLAAIKKLSGCTDDSGSKEYNPGELPTNLTSGFNIGWKWEFETASNASQDETDSVMGNAETLENVSITITVTATQID